LLQFTSIATTLDDTETGTKSGEGFDESGRPIVPLASIEGRHWYFIFFLVQSFIQGEIPAIVVMPLFIIGPTVATLNTLIPFIK
jgi:hypothetical protein